MWSPDSSTTGGAQTGFTTPAFTLTADSAPVSNARQHTVTAVSGTLTATANSVSSPFSATFYKPASLVRLPNANPLTGLRGSIPNNQWKLVIRKGSYAAADVPCQMTIRLLIDVPAGMDAYKPDDLRAGVSFLVGLLNEESADLGDTLVAGILP